jgi:hypothetical protein
MTLCIGCKRYTVLNASYLVRLPYCAIQPSTAISHVSLFSSQEASSHENTCHLDWRIVKMLFPVFPSHDPRLLYMKSGGPYASSSLNSWCNRVSLA